MVHCIYLYIRDGFRVGDLVTCHPLFSDMTLQSKNFSNRAVVPNFVI